MTAIAKRLAEFVELVKEHGLDSKEETKFYEENKESEQLALLMDHLRMAKREELERESDEAYRQRQMWAEVTGESLDDND